MSGEKRFAMSPPPGDVSATVTIYDDGSMDLMSRGPRGGSSSISISPEGAADLLRILREEEELRS